MSQVGDLEHPPGPRQRVYRLDMGPAEALLTRHVFGLVNALLARDPAVVDVASERLYQVVKAVGNEQTLKPLTVRLYQLTEDVKSGWEYLKHGATPQGGT